MFKNKSLIFAAAVVAVVVVVGVVLLLQTQAAQAAPKITPAEYQSQYGETGTTHLLIDVRTADEFATGHIHGAVNIPLQSIQDHMSEIPHDVPVIVYCHSGNRSGQAGRALVEAGYTNIQDLGGINAWTEQGYPIE
ncbi:MAG: rhodanese-like domain-containing protein [Anaerolineae bacterium]